MLNIIEMQTKTTMQYHLTPFEKLSSKRPQIANVGKDGEKSVQGKTLVHLWRMQIGAATVENRFLKKLKIELP